MRTKLPMRARCVALALCMGCCTVSSQSIGAQQEPAVDDLPLSTNAAGPAGFVAAHGQRVVVMGYSSPGLEIWAYPIQILQDYQLSFLIPGVSRPLAGTDLLRRIEYRPDEIIRTYIGPDFVVREHIFVPLDKPAAIFSFEVQGRAQPDIRVSFLPVMNLMWPGALGGQEVQWDDALHGFILQEQSQHMSAFVAAASVIAHTTVVNATLRQDLSQSITLRPVTSQELQAQRRAQLFVGLAGQRPKGVAVALQGLNQQADALQREAQTYEHRRWLSGLRLKTPDDAVNQAFAWSQVALDQAWVCNPQLGCGIVAGYGPSRGQRRPQYDWFFAGDGLVATDALLATGNLTRARDELAFILKYQNPANGMIWHELSQSAGFLDWAGKYPYMFVHVDITFDFLRTMQQYLAASGDEQFVLQNWSHVQAAYQYCLSVVDPATGLPVVPFDKESGDEQVRMRDDLSLSSAWLAASRAYAQLASATGHGPEAADATQQAALTARSIAAQYWDPASGFWLDGHTVSGVPSMAERSRPAALLTQRVFSPAQQDAILDKLSSTAFQTDWGTRSLSSRSPGFDPDSYARGSVSALGTANLASALWTEHRPAAAWQAWSALLPWLEIDSLGHMPEVLDGDVFAEQEESVPEQTWSSAGFLQAAMQGLLGITVQASPPTLRMAPHLPPQWQQLSLQNLHVGTNATLTVAIRQSAGATELDVVNDGMPVDLIFSPQIPFGATLLRAEQDGHSVPVAPQLFAQDEHALVALRAHSGTTTCVLHYAGGVEVWVPAQAPHQGDASTQVRVVGQRLLNGRLTIQWQGPEAGAGGAPRYVLLRTPWLARVASGGTLAVESKSPEGSYLYRIALIAGAGAQSTATEQVVLDLR